MFFKAHIPASFVKNKLILRLRGGIRPKFIYVEGPPKRFFKSNFAAAFVKNRITHRFRGKNRSKSIYG